MLSLQTCEDFVTCENNEASWLEFDIFEVEYWRAVAEKQQLKFDALYTHCRNLADELENSKSAISALKESEAMAQNLYQKTRAMTKSLLALGEKERKVKLIHGDHQLAYNTVSPMEDTRLQMEEAAQRQKEKVRQDRLAEIARLCNAVDKIAAKYDRYDNVSTVIKLPSIRYTNNDLPDCVPIDLMGLWLLVADQEIQPSTREMELYEDFLRLQVRPPPIYSPDLRRPYVNWVNLNKHRRKNLPDPVFFPVQSAPTDPAF